MTYGKACRAAQLYSRWHPGRVVVYATGGDEFNWTELRLWSPARGEAVITYEKGQALQEA